MAPVTTLLDPKRCPREELLGGVIVLHGKALAYGQRPINLTTVPYQAWRSRRVHEMTVWILDAANP